LVGYNIVLDKFNTDISYIDIVWVQCSVRSGELQESTGIAVTGMDTHNRGPNDLHTGSNKPYIKKKGKKLIKTRKKKTKTRRLLR